MYLMKSHVYHVQTIIMSQQPNILSYIIHKLIFLRTLTAPKMAAFCNVAKTTSLKATTTKYYCYCYRDAGNG